MKSTCTPDDLKIMIVSTPKTGNTWIKHLLCAIYELPIVQVGPRFDPAEVDALGPRWVTHQHYAAQPQIIEYGEDNSVVFVTTVRHPGDALLSKFHFVRSYIDRLAFSEVDLSPEMARDGDTMGEHTEYYVRHGFPISLDISLSWMRSGKSHVVRYEDLWRSPVARLKKLTDAIGEVEIERIESAVALCDFDLMRTRPGADPKFFRKGKVGDWKTALPQHIMEIFRHTDPYPAQFAALGYTLGPDDPLTTLPRRSRPSRNPFDHITHFDNGVPVPPVLGRLYLSLELDPGKRWPSLEQTTAGSFYSWLNAPADEDPQRRTTSRRPRVTNLAHYIYQTHPGARKVFPGLFEEDRVRYIAWFVFRAQTEYDLDQAFIQPMLDDLLAWCDRPAAEDPHQPEAKPTLTNLALYIYHIRPDLQIAFQDVFEKDRLGFARWFVNYAPKAYASDKSLVEPVRRSAQIISQTLPEARSPILSSLFTLRRRMASILDEARAWIRERRE